MIVEIVLAAAITLVAMVGIGTIIRGILGLRRLVNYVVQQAVLGAIAYVALVQGWPLIPIAIMALTPLVLHALSILLKVWIIWRTKRGDYGEHAKWAYELFKEEDTEFIRASNALPKMDIREISIIADSKQEFRELTVERYEERLAEQ